MKVTFLCISSLVLSLGMTVTGQSQSVPTTTAVTAPINPTWTGSTTWNANPTWSGSTMWNANPSWSGSTVWNGNQMSGRPFYNPFPYSLQGQTVYCYPINPPLYRSFEAVPFGPIQEIGTVIGGFREPLGKKK